MRLAMLLLIPGLIVGGLFACRKQVSPPVEKPVYSWLEEFDTLQTALRKGWVAINNSRPLGTSSWAQGSYIFLNGKVSGFPAGSYRYSGNDYVFCGFNCGADRSTLSAWLISPSTMVKNGDELIFHTRTSTFPANYADRMEVRLNPTDDGIDVGNGPLKDTLVARAVGKFTTLLTAVNPNLELTGPNAYPGTWKRYTVTINNLPEAGYHRFAFRYFVTSGGPGGTNSDGVGVDSVAFVSK